VISILKEEMISIHFANNTRMRERCYLKEKEESETERRWNYEKDVYLDGICSWDFDSTICANKFGENFEFPLLIMLNHKKLQAVEFRMPIKPQILEKKAWCSK